MDLKERIVTFSTIEAVLSDFTRCLLMCFDSHDLLMENYSRGSRARLSYPEACLAHAPHEVVKSYSGNLVGIR